METQPPMGTTFVISNFLVTTREKQNSSNRNPPKPNQTKKTPNKTKHPPKAKAKPGETNFNNVFYLTQYIQNLVILTNN